MILPSTFARILAAISSASAKLVYVLGATAHVATPLVTPPPIIFHHTTVVHYTDIATAPLILHIRAKCRTRTANHRAKPERASIEWMSKDVIWIPTTATQATKESHLHIIYIYPIGIYSEIVTRHEIHSEIVTRHVFLSDPAAELIARKGVHDDAFSCDELGYNCARVNITSKGRNCRLAKRESKDQLVL